MPPFSLGRAVAGACFLVTLLTPVIAFPQAQPPASTAAEATIRRPTDFRSRAELRHEYQDLQNGGHRNLLIPRFEYAASSSLAFRIETPYVWYEAPGADRVAGHGDLLLRGAWRATQRDGFALILVTEVTFDTASDDRLGQGQTVISPLVYAAIDVPEIESVFFPNFQHYFSAGGDGTHPDVSQTVLKPNLLTRWPKRFYTFLEPAFLIDHERNSKVGLTVELEVGKLVSRHVAVWGRPGVGVIKNDLPQIYNWNIEIGARYIF
ncbi:MAG TPA: hypothetical protein VNM24_07890 [Burkholderiales bacterium]|jgi:hypothetical protein|nr:hypothetical protein [Burkholderiales bacterium]